MKKLALLALMYATYAAATITPKTPEKGEDGYYSINNVEELYGFAKLVDDATDDQEFPARLEADIVINKNLFEGVEINMADTLPPEPLCITSGDSCNFEKWNPMGDRRHHYYGHFDGQGHTISGVFINLPQRDSVGFFGTADGMIENLNIADSYIAGRIGVGGITGAGRGYLFSCSFSGTVRAQRFAGGIGGLRGGFATDCHNSGYIYAGSYAGGILASTFYRVDRCYNTGTVRSYGPAGGIVGELDPGRIERSYNAGIVMGGTSAGGIVGYYRQPVFKDTLIDSYNLGPVSGKSNVGALIGEIEGSEGLFSNCYALKGTAEITSSIGESDSIKFVDEAQLTDGTLLRLLNSRPFFNDWEQGETYPVLKNTKPKFRDGIFEIENEEQFMWFANYINEYKPTMGYLEFALVNDLVFNKNVQSSECVQKQEACDFAEWKPIYGHIYSDAPGFHGVFDGGFHTISGLYSSKSSGLFQQISWKGRVKNVILLDSYFTGNEPGAIALYNSGMVADCFSDAILVRDRELPSVGAIGGRGTVAYTSKGNTYEMRYMRKDLWFNGTKLSPYMSKVCQSRDDWSCEPNPEFDASATKKDQYTMGSYVAFPYPRIQNEENERRIYPYRNFRYPAESCIDSLGYLTFKYKIASDTEKVHVGFWFREDSLGPSFYVSPSFGVDISEAEGICATYTSDQDVYLSIKNYERYDTIECSIKIPKSQEISTVQTLFKDYQYSHRGADTTNSFDCSTVISHAQALWFEMDAAVAKNGAARIFEIGPKGTCKGNKKIADEPENFCYVGSPHSIIGENICKEPYALRESKHQPNVNLSLNGVIISFVGVTVGATYKVIDLKGNTVKSGFTTSGANLKDLKSGVYVVRIFEGNRAIFSKMILNRF